MSENVALGMLTVNVSTFSIDNKNNVINAKNEAFNDKKWRLQRTVKKMSENTSLRVLDCMNSLGKVEVLRSGDSSKFGGVMFCNSVWLCPVCSQRIAFERGELIKETVKSGFNMLLVTATLQHNSSDKLKDLLEALKEALRKLKQGRWWLDFRGRFGVEAYVSSYEITHGKNGWHPHSHILVYVSKEVDIDDFWQRLVERYVSLVDKTGHYASVYHSMDVKKADENAGQYLTKWSLGSELAEGYKKSSKTIWDLVEANRKDLFLEYAYATKGLKSLTWSHNAREKLGVKDFEVEYPQEWETIAFISSDVWRVIREKALQGVCLRLAVLEDNGKLLYDYLRELGNEALE